MADEIIQGLIYRITSESTPLVYIGSTIRSLNIRFKNHKASYKQWLKDATNFTSSFEILKFDDAKIELIEEFPCDDIRELRRREGEIIRQTENCINKRIEGRTRQEFMAEYREKNKDRRREQNIAYYEANKEKFREQKAEYYEANKEKFREHYEANKEKISEYATKYRQANKEKLSQKFDCDCGGRYVHQKKSLHLKTAKHQAYLAKQKRITIEVDSDVDLIDDLDCLALGYE